MAVNLDESKYFKFVIISDKPKPSKNKFTEKPSKDKDIMSTKSSTSPPPSNNNEKSLDEKKQNSQETNKQPVPEVKVNEPLNNNGETKKEQEIEEISSRSVPNSLSIEVPSKSTPPPIVTSPSEITRVKTPEPSIITRAKTPEPSISPISSQNVSMFKKLENLIRNSPDTGTVSDTIPEQGEATTLDSKAQTQQEQDNSVVNNNITENIANAARSVDENQKVDKKDSPGTAATKQRTGSLASLANMKMFITRTSSVLVEKIKEEFDNLDRRIYPEIDPEWAEENKVKLNRGVVTNEREQLLENKDITKNNEITNGTSQKYQSTQSALADAGIALNERKEKLDNIGEKAEELNNHSVDFLELAKQLRKDQEQKNSKPWKIW